MFDKIIQFIRSLYPDRDYIPLHEPRFMGNEKKYLSECIDSTFVSSVGEYVNRLEIKLAETTGAKYSVVTVNGTSALHMALITSQVGPGDEVITQPLTFVATINAVIYAGATPVFIDVDKETLGLSPTKLESFLLQHCESRSGFCYNKISGKRIKACIPMHTFGQPCFIDKIIDICEKYNITVIEDAAESLGSGYKNKHTGTFGKCGVLSFNGNKIVTAGGGGAIITSDEALAFKARHLTTTAKIPHKWEFVHDEVGYNYRMPNINAALVYAQLENLDKFIQNKRETANKYKTFFNGMDGIHFFSAIENAFSNYWLNTLIFESEKQKTLFLEYTNSNNVMTRPIWRPMHKLKMFKDYYCSNLDNTDWLEKRIVNIPSSVRI